VTQVAPGAAAAGVHGFTAALTSFVGRTAEVAELAAMLDEYRLVTVTGPGGVGKTRIVEQVARRSVGRFADGVWLAELASVSDPALVPTAVCSALGVHQAPGVPVLDSLVTVLARQQLLLGVAGEARYRLPPLGLPVTGRSAGIGESDAVALFADRARRG
jgi:predicted ATPase